MKIVMCSLFLQGKIIHFSLLEGNPLGEGTGFNHGELICKTWKWLNFRKLLTAFPALGNSKITIGLSHFINSPEGQKYALCSKEYKTKSLNIFSFHKNKLTEIILVLLKMVLVTCSRNIQGKNEDFLPYPQFKPLATKLIL